MRSVVRSWRRASPALTGLLSGSSSMALFRSIKASSAVMERGGNGEGNGERVVVKES